MNQVINTLIVNKSINAENEEMSKTAPGHRHANIAAELGIPISTKTLNNCLNKPNAMNCEQTLTASESPRRTNKSKRGGVAPSVLVTKIRSEITWLAHTAIVQTCFRHACRCRPPPPQEGPFLNHKA